MTLLRIHIKSNHASNRLQIECAYELIQRGIDTRMIYFEEDDQQVAVMRLDITP